MLRRSIQWLAACSLFICSPIEAEVQEGPDLFQPDLTKLGFDVSKIKITPESRTAAARLLVSNVSEVDPAFDAKLIGLALAIAPENPEARQVGRSLQNQLPVKRLQPPNPIASAKYFADLGRYFRETGGEDNGKLGALFVNVALHFDYNNQRAQQEAKLLPPPVWAFVHGGGDDGSGVTPQRTEANAYALTVMQKRDYSRAGSRMELSIKCEPFEGGSITFGSNIGDETKSSANNALRLLGGLRPSVPKKYKFHVEVKPKDDPVDGASAGTAMTLLMFSLFDKVPIESSLAVTGEIMPNGTVGRVGGVAYKLKGAHSSGTKVVAIPLKNLEEVCDFAILNSPDQLWDMHIFTYDSFPQLLQAARSERSEQLTKAMELFERARKEYRENRSQPAKAYQNLKEVVKLAPNHASAAVLARLLSSPRPPRLSFYTSVGEIDQLAWKFSLMIAAARRELAIPPAMLKDLKAGLEILRRKSDSKVATWISVMSDVVQELEGVGNPSQLPHKLELLTSKIMTLVATIDGAIGKQAILVQQERKRHGAD